MQEKHRKTKLTNIWNFTLQNALITLKKWKISINLSIFAQANHIIRQMQHSDNPHKPQGALGKILKFVIPFIVSVGLCVALFRDIDFHEMMHVIRTQCDFRWIGLMLVMGMVPMVLRALRWGIQLRASGIDAPVHVLLYSIFGTYAVNIVFPRLGEVWRSGYVAYREEAPFSTVFGSMVADRFADLVVVGLLTLFTLGVAHNEVIDFIRAYPRVYMALLNVMTSPWTWTLLTSLFVAAWVVMHRSHNRYVLRIKIFVRGLWGGFVAIVHMKGKFQWLGLTVCIWGCYFLQMVMALNAFPMTANLLYANGLILVLVCFVLISISMGIPSNGGIGPYQTALLFGLTLFMPHGADRALFNTTGAALGNVVMASQTVALIVLGIMTFVLIAVDKHHRRAVNK